MTNKISNLKQISFLCFFFFIFLTSIMGQKIKEETDVTTANPAFFRVTDMFDLDVYTETLCFDKEKNEKTCPLPNYGFFWIFGDGHFDYVLGQEFGSVAASLASNSPWINYNSSVSDNRLFPVTTYFTNRYSDTPPPSFGDYSNRLNGEGGEPDIVNIETAPAGSVAGSIPSSFDSSIDYTPSDQTPSSVGRIGRVSIVANQEPRTSFPMVFSLSFLPPTGAGAIHFLYNDEIKNADNLLEKTTISPNPYPAVFEYEKTHFPYYYSRDNTDTTFNSGLPYSNIITYKFDTRDYSGEFPGLMRMFHAFFINKKYTEGTQEKDISPKYKFLAILTGDDHQTDFDSLGSFEEEALDTLLSTGGGRFGNYNIVDIAEFTMSLHQGNDPNELCVTDIYEDETEEDSYRVFFNLLVCNEGFGASNYINLTLVENRKFYKDLVLEKFSGLGDEQSFPIEDPFDHTFSFSTEDFFLNGVVEGVTIGQCMNVTFSVKTNAEGVAALQEENVIEASVQLVQNGHKEIARCKTYCDCHGVFDEIKPIPSSRGCTFLGLSMMCWCLILLVILIICCLILLLKK